MLTIRPGYISWAILELASACNASPWSLKLQLEEEYIQKKTFMFDLLVLRKAVQGLIASRGNIKEDISTFFVYSIRFSLPLTSHLVVHPVT